MQRSSRQSDPDAVPRFSFPETVTVGPLAGVYFLRSRGQVVYVGQSRNVYSRLDSHMADPRKSFDTADFLPVEDDAERTKLEAALILSLDHPLNEVFPSISPAEARLVLTRHGFMAAPDDATPDILRGWSAIAEHLGMQATHLARLADTWDPPLPVTRIGRKVEIARAAATAWRRAHTVPWAESRRLREERGTKSGV